MDPEHANKAQLLPKRLLTINHFWKMVVIFFTGITSGKFLKSGTLHPRLHKQAQLSLQINRKCQEEESLNWIEKGDERVMGMKWLKMWLKMTKTHNIHL